MNISQYKTYLQLHGRNEAEVKKNQSDYIIDRTFKRDPNYKRIYILTKEGWIYEDVKYQFHVASSILKDAVDYYIQFRPGIHYPVGSYVIIPDDTSFDINLSEEQLENPFLQPVSDRTQWWFIVGKDNARSYVRYNILKCNWNFQWIWHGQILESFGSVRNANSYTSGVWHDDMSESLDNITSAWLPDYSQAYGIENLKNLGLCNNQTITYNQRFMITDSDYEPKCYRVTKVIELMPKGVIKFTLKQDEFNENRDEPKLQICDYYTNEGDIIRDYSLPLGDISIISCSLDENGEMFTDVELNTDLYLGKPLYFKADTKDVQWDVESESDYYTNLISVTPFGDGTVCLRPGKAKSLIGKKVTLTAFDGEQKSSIELEVKG